MFEDHVPRDRSLRAADADRESASEILREQHLAGRLDTDELQERLERCYAAKTYAELDSLLADLPRQRSSPISTATGRSSRRPRIALLLPLLVLLVALIAVSHGHALWLALPFAFFFLRRGHTICEQRLEGSEGIGI